ncbi:MAG TPA: phosphatase PAP2 family protein [Acidimicrobiales bacterium]|nr:phosphatase PAP2 family protein [Acidimicrobiales bacterium]
MAVPGRGDPPPAAEPASRAARLAGARPWGRHATEAAAGVGLLGLGTLLLSDRVDTVPGWEIDVFEAVNGLPDALRWPIWPVMQLGSFWMLVGGAVVAWLVTRRRRPVYATVATVLLAWTLARVVKRAIDRGRPGDLLDTVRLRESGLEGHGFVSGHATVAFAVATVLTPLLPHRWRWLPFTLACGVAFARVYYGAHLPLDVVGGAGLGILCGLAASIAIGTIDPLHDR